MECLIGTPLNETSTGQSHLKAMKQNSVIPIPPLFFALGIEMDHAIDSESLLTERPKLGYSTFYDEAKWYKQSLVMSESTLSTFVITGLIQFVADNLYHNVYSLDGRGTFHGMGFIACSMEKKITPDKRVKGFEKVMKSSNVAKRVEVNIHWYTQLAYKALPKIKFTLMKDLINQLPSSS